MQIHIFFFAFPFNKIYIYIFFFYPRPAFFMFFWHIYYIIYPSILQGLGL